MEEFTKKCKCGSNNKIVCPRCSKIKMCICLKIGNDNLKFEASNGAKINPVWYSILSKNRKSTRDIINSMIRRFLDSSQYKGKVNQLIFYDNATKQEIQKVLIK